MKADLSPQGRGWRGPCPSVGHRLLHALGPPPLDSSTTDHNVFTAWATFWLLVAKIILHVCEITVN